MRRVGENPGLCYELGVFEHLDSIKYLMLHFRVEWADPELFARLETSLTIPHAVECLIQDDVYFQISLLLSMRPSIFRKVRLYGSL